ncbi:MAG: universal stress protein [Rhizomicrobium sp.]
MYKRIVLAYDGSVEGRAALREGALLAQRCGAQVFLLSVVPDTGGLLLAEGVHPGALGPTEDAFLGVLKEGVERLKKLGFNPVAKLARGEPVFEIGAFAKQIGADLIVVGLQRQSTLARWWSGSTGAYLIDYTHCSLLVSRNVVSEDAFKIAPTTSDEPTK